MKTILSLISKKIDLISFLEVLVLDLESERSEGMHYLFKCVLFIFVCRYVLIPLFG